MTRGISRIRAARYDGFRLSAGLRRGAGVAGALVALAVAVAVPATALGSDPALDALRDGDAYVSPRVLGPDTIAAQQRLDDAAELINGLRRPVKLALVFGPVGSPSLQVYVRRLASRLHYAGTLVITNRGGTLAAAGPRGTANMTRALRTERVGRIADPIERLTRAADVAAPPPVDLARAGRRSTLVLILLGALGGGWAVAIGVGRQGRRTRRDVAEARSRTRVCVDALRAHTTALARRPDLSPAQRQRVMSALGIYAEAISALPEMRDAEAITAFAPRLRTALDEVAATTAAVTGMPPETDPFAGLCGADPAHGVAVEAAGGRPLCADCRGLVARGEDPPIRMLFEDGAPVPFDAARYEPVLRPGTPA